MAKTSIRVTSEDNDTIIELTPVRETTSRNVFEYEVDTTESKIYATIYHKNNTIPSVVFTLTRDDWKMLKDAFTMLENFF